MSDPVRHPSTSAMSFFAIARLVKEHYTSEQDDTADGTWQKALRDLLVRLDGPLSQDPVIMDATVRYTGVPQGLRVFTTLLSIPDEFRGPQDTLQHIRQTARRDVALGALVSVLEPRITKVIAPILAERLSQPDSLDLLRSAFRDLFSPKRLPNLLAVIHDLTKPEFLPVMEDLTRFVARHVSEDALPQITKLLTGVACAAVGDASASDMAEGLAEPCIVWARRVTQAWVHNDPDEWLDINQAAEYLGIRPRTLHVHIRNHAGKPSELPIERRTGPGYRGRGKFYIRAGDLNGWATMHWHSRRKRAIAAISAIV